MRLTFLFSLFSIGCAEADSTGSSDDGSDPRATWELESGPDDDPGDEDEHGDEDDPLEDDPLDDEPVDDDPLDDDPIDDDTGAEFDDEPVASGSSLYSSTCQECHGYPSIFTTELVYMSDADVFDRIRYGGYEMPAQPQLRDAEIEALIAYLR